MSNKFLKSVFSIIVAVLLVVVPTSTTFAKNNKDYTAKSIKECHVINEVKEVFSQDDKNESFSKRVETVNISEDKVCDLSTSSLLDLIMDYPFLGNIFAYNDFNEGLDSIINAFTPLSIFIERQDASSVIDSKYNEIKQSDDKFIEKTFLEVLGTRVGYSYCKEDSLVKSSRAYTESTKYVTTPKGSKVEVLVLGEQLSYTRKGQINEYFAKEFPYATLISEPTTNYNCHSYAWYSQSTSNKYWMNSPVKYYADGSYSVSSNNSGSVAIYFGHPNITVGNPIHSAVVEGDDVFVSKWGQAGLYRHSPNHSPYNTDGPYIKYFNKN